MAGLFIGSLIVDALVPIVGLTIKHYHDQHHHDSKPGAPSTPHSHGRDITDVSSGDMDYSYDFETPSLTPEMIMNPVNKRSVNPIETPKPKRVYEDPERVARDVKFTGPSYTAGWCRDFSAIQRTRINPVTGRIIGYKGIPRKRSLSPTSKYSAFWRQQKYAKPSFHAARSPGIWDSARR